MLNERLVRVVLYGALAEEFGAEHKFAIGSPAEAIRALTVNYPGFRPALIKCDRYGIVADGDWREGDEAAILPVSRELHIVPMIEGKFDPVSWAAIGSIAIGTTTLGAIGTQILIGVVVSALIWGIQQLFAQPVEEDKGDKRDESYFFSGQVNVTAQGSAVPVVYGRCYVGSVVVSAGISVGDQRFGTGAGNFAIDERGDQPQEPTHPSALRNTTPLTPTLVLQNVGSPDVPVMRVGPEGWRHVGMVTVVDDEGIYREVDLFVPPEAGSPYRWDYWRGFERYQPGEQGMLGT
jgi:predicted phage tail protein